MLDIVAASSMGQKEMGDSESKDHHMYVRSCFGSNTPLSDVPSSTDVP
jgi:hypothetical protein